MKRLTIVLASIVWGSFTYAVVPVFDAAALIQLANQLIQLKQETQYIKAGLDQLKNDQYEWAHAQDLINNLGNVVNQSNTISYSASNIDGQFRKYFPGYQSPQDFNEQYRTNNEATLNTLNSVLQSMGASANDFQNENRRLEFLQHQSQSAHGQTQAIQAASEISSELVTQLQLMRQTVMAQTNAQTAFYANEVQNEVSAKAELDKIINSGSTQMIPYGSSGNYLTVPEYQGANNE